MSIVSCKKSGSPDWSAHGTERSTTAPTGAPAPSPLEIASPAPKAKAPKIKLVSNAPQESATSSGIRFITYNIENWLTMDRDGERKQSKASTKPESEKQAVIQILARHSPDVVGLCEIGTAADLAEIQEDLKAAGVDLPNSHYTGGSDPTRHLGLLSKFPIISTAKPTETTYQLDGRTLAINRGILDATIEARGKSYRFLGVHLKSKREVAQGDQEAMRLHEALLLRRHVDSIFKSNPSARLIVYGDFNDTRASSTLKAVTGQYSDPTYLTAIPTKDSRQMAWTHYWALHDIYSRFDFIMISPALKKEVDFPAAKIIDDETWNNASDHRAVLAIFK